MKIKDIYDCFDRIGFVTFATWTGSDIETRIAHLFAFDDDGIYLRTMYVKPFFQQLVQYRKVSVCGMYPDTRIEHDENNLPLFVPGYTIRMSGEVRELSLEEIEEKAKTDVNFNAAVYDVKKYPATRVLVIYKAKGELYDFDYQMKNRDHKLLRTAFAFGGAAAAPAGLHINDKCTGCGMCEKVCTFKAISAGPPYRINGERCDECGSCYSVCAENAIDLRD